MKLLVQCDAKRHQLNIPSSATYGQLKAQIVALTSIPAASFQVKSGFPPKPMGMNENDTIDGKLQNGEKLVIEQTTGSAPTSGGSTSSGTSGPLPQASSTSKKPIASGDALAIAALSAPPAARKPAQAAAPPPGWTRRITAKPVPSNKVPTGEIDWYRGALLDYTVPSDNSCLFHAIKAITGTRDSIPKMRKIVADSVVNNIGRYLEFLTYEPNDYAKFITNMNAWGGNIELSALSLHYKIQLQVVVIQSTAGHVNYGGEDKFPRVGYLAYDGAHYDPLMWYSHDGYIVSNFEITDSDAYARVLVYREERHASGNFIDLTRGKFICNNCKRIFIGDEQLNIHAKNTRHTAFEQLPNEV